jgi:hypothetical protein
MVAGRAVCQFTGRRLRCFVRALIFAALFSGLTGSSHREIVCVLFRDTSLLASMESMD